MDTDRASSDWEAPSRREREILQGIARGLNIATIADRLDIAEDVARADMRNLLHRLRTSNRLEAVLLALQRGWIDVPPGGLPGELTGRWID
jgi:two-component system nitrate/nitrite response regulator NarL